jgi:molybdopterin-guanine dinucleotide biosynthesis protein B
MGEMVRCVAMRVAAVTGLSGSGKTTLIEALIRIYVARGERVAAIKHTHHELNLENRGDTSRFLAAGASPVALVSGGEAAIWSAAALPPLRVEINESGGMAAALQIIEADIVLVEGFKDDRTHPRVEPRTTPDEAAAMLDRIWRSS